MQRDNLDFKSMSVSKLFTKQLFPHVAGYGIIRIVHCCRRDIRRTRNR